MKARRQSYEERSNHFAKACDIGIEVISEASLEGDNKEHLLRLIRSSKQMALFPEPVFKRIGSLKCIESDFFNYWNEESGLHIDAFWCKIKAAGLSYERNDIFRKVLSRGRISDRTEYDYIIDEILVAQQTGAISENDTSRLNQYLLNYEKTKKGKS